MPLRFQQSVLFRETLIADAKDLIVDMGGSVINWVSVVLANSFFYVKVGKESSELSGSSGGAQQRAVSGPLILLFHITDHVTTWELPVQLGWRKTELIQGAKGKSRSLPVVSTGIGIHLCKCHPLPNVLEDSQRLGFRATAIENDVKVARVIGHERRT